MRAVATAVAWEFWMAHRRGWLILLMAIPLCAVLYRTIDVWLKEFDVLRTLSFLPFVASLILAAAFSNFTVVNRRSGIAGFPQHLFARPVDHRLLVTCVMACAVLSVVGVYVAWATIVFQPAGVALLVRWPATLLAVGVVLYQAIIWTLNDLRVTRIVVLSLVVTLLVGVGFLPFMPPQLHPLGEGSLTIALWSVAALAYAASILSIGYQRRGGGFRLVTLPRLVERVFDAFPRRGTTLRSRDHALYWFEWRCCGWVLPGAVLLTTSLVMGPILSLTGRGEDATLRAVAWLSVLPLLLAGPIGKGLAKPNFWSLELAISPFFSARPISAGQIIAAKLKLAAASALLAWAVLLVVAVPWLAWTCDLGRLRELWNTLHVVYSPFVVGLLLLLVLFAAILVTWNLMVTALWMGYTGRTGPYYTYVAASLIAGFVFAVWLGMWLERPGHRAEFFLAVQPYVPWLLATLIALKCGFTITALIGARRRRLIADRTIVRFTCLWVFATASPVLLACLMSPHIDWLRNMLILAALLAVPSARIAAAPLAIALNRHA